MTTATPPKTDAGVEFAVEDAFDELDCCSRNKEDIPCGGTIRGFLELHNCNHGWLCQEHWKNVIENLLPRYKADITAQGWAAAVCCHNRFTDVRKFIRLYPL